jgi:hypothetical protein
MIDAEKYQPVRQNMKFVTRSLSSLATKLHMLARPADIFGINQFTNINTDTSIFVYSREKSHDSKYSKYASQKHSS